jgi:hypothetical protein
MRVGYWDLAEFYLFKDLGLFVFSARLMKKIKNVFYFCSAEVSSMLY